MTLIDTKQLNKLWAKSTDLRNPQRDRSLYDLAFFLWSNKQFDEAIAVTGAALDSLSEKEGSSLWLDVKHLQSLALHDAKRDEEAIKTSLEALQFAEALLPSGERGFMHLHLADCYRTTEQPELQEAQYEKAVEAFSDTDNKFMLSQALIDLGNLRYRASRYLESKKQFQQAVPILEELQSTDRMPFIKYRLAGIERHLGKPLLALALAEEAVQLSKFVDDVVATRENTIELALVHEALEHFEMAIDLLDDLINENDDQIKNRSAAKAVYYRARIHKATGKFQESLNGFKNSVSLLRAVGLDDLAVNAELELIHMTIKGPIHDGF